MDAPRKVIVGYDLCDDVTQISCYSYKSNEPIPIDTKEGEDFCPIPTVLCVKKETKQWLFGEEALLCANSGEGILVGNLLSKLKSGEEVELLQQRFSAITLMEKYLRKTLSLIKNYFPTEPITKLVVTLRSTDPEIVDRIYETLALLGLEKDRAVVISHAGAYLYYALCQDRSLWTSDVGLFDFTEEGLNYYQIRMNRRSKPMIAGLYKTEYHDTLSFEMLKSRNSNPAYVFENIANTVLYKQLISTIYFTGKGFEGGWADSVIKSLCTGRRVFFGQNLFTKGACFAAKELSGDRKLEDLLLLNDDMITSSVFLRVYCDSKYQEVPLIEAGAIWYEVNNSLEVIPEATRELEIVLKNIMTRDIIRQKFNINNLPERPDRMTRLKLRLTCRSKTTGIITISDLGFGEIYPETGDLEVFTIEL